MTRLPSPVPRVEARMQPQTGENPNPDEAEEVPQG